MAVDLVLTEGDDAKFLRVETSSAAYTWQRTDGDATALADYFITRSAGLPNISPSFAGDAGSLVNAPLTTVLFLRTLQDSEPESAETISYHFTTLIGNRLTSLDLNVTILDRSARDEYIDAAIAKADLQFDANLQPMQLLAQSYTNVVTDFLGPVNNPGAYNGAAMEAQQYLLGVLAGADWSRLGGLPLAQSDFTPLRWAADHFDRDWLISDPDLGGDAPVGVLDLLQGFLEGANGDWRRRLADDPGPANTDALQVVVRSSDVFHDSWGFRGDAIELSGSPNLPSGPALLVDKIGGAYALSSGDDGLLTASQVNVSLGAGADLAVATATGSQLLGEDGDDMLALGQGGTLLGGGGADLLVGGDGSNFLRGEDGTDFILGGAGFDDVNGNRDSDTIDGGSGGGDWLVGGQGSDSITAHSGDGVLLGNMGNDSLVGGAGHETLRGGQDNDLLVGGDGDDWLSGDRGNDQLTGGAGADTFHSFGAAGVDLVLDFDASQGDRVLLDAATTYTATQVGADTVISMNGGGQMVLVGVRSANLPSDWIAVG